LKFYYDLHIHSTLSPCGDDDNTPNNIVGMASLCGLNILALTDHNSAQNCPAFFQAAKKYNIIPIAGMELTTAEDIHVICLFEELSGALEFDSYVNNHRCKIKNRPEIFGHQTIFDEMDEPIGEIEDLLINASDISCDKVAEIVASFGGICYPAHIDRDANGIIAILGTLPECGFKFYEIHDGDKIGQYSDLYSIPKDRLVISSDAHRLTEMRDKENFIDLECDPTDEAAVRRALFDYFGR
jgi:PHP family Zn ribbon phosphoesterase